MNKESKAERHAYRGPVRRLRVEVKDGTWRVIKDTRVPRMTLRAHWAPAAKHGLDGAHFVEVRDNDDVVLHRQKIRDPLDTSIEVFERGRISRVETDREMVLDILVPEPPGPGRVRLVVNGADLPLREGKKKPHTRGFRLPALK